MNQTKPIEVKVLMEEAKKSRDKEAYKLLEKAPSYRIGVGARTDSPNSPSFFIEAIKFSKENGKVNLPSVEKNLILAESASAHYRKA